MVWEIMANIASFVWLFYEPGQDHTSLQWYGFGPVCYPFLPSGS
jgi:hypothetical protein